MSNDDILKSLVDDSGLTLIGDPISDPEVEGGKIIFVKPGKGVATSLPNMIEKTVREIRKAGLTAKVVSPSQADSQVETFLSASIKARLPDVDFDITLSTTQGIAAVWIDVKSEIGSGLEKKVDEEVQNFLSQVGFKDSFVRFRAAKNFPSQTTCLRVLRKNSPCSLETLTQLLQLPGFDALTLREVRRFLDTARRNGLVIRRNDGNYILTLKCLMDLGSSRDRFSPDISRALALRRLGV